MVTDGSVIEQEFGNDWVMYNGDCVEVVRHLPENSVGYTVFSPPFSKLYCYSNSLRDMGNSRSDDEFMDHFKFLASLLLKATMPGRLMSIHCMDIPAMKERDGYIGLKDFPGDILRTCESAGWIYHGRTVIWKDPLIEATRTKALGLMHKQIVKDSSMCRCGLPDYVLTFRKFGENPKAIAHPKGFTTYIGIEPPQDGTFSHQTWRRYASPIWTDIDQTRTLNREGAREESDEAHICPLQLDTIARLLELYSTKGDTVLSPFAGIGSEGYEAVKIGRKFIGIELKPSYYRQAVKNLQSVENAATQQDLFGNWHEAA